MEPQYDPTGTPNRRLLTVPEAAKALRTSRSTIYRQFLEGELRWVRVGSSRRVTAAEIDRYIRQHTEGGTDGDD
jgi:excisionase family DNA binding protein